MHWSWGFLKQCDTTSESTIYHVVRFIISAKTVLMQYTYRLLLYGGIFVQYRPITHLNRGITHVPIPSAPYTPPNPFL